MADKVNGNHRSDDKTGGKPNYIEEEQRLAYINALQSYRVTVLVGPSQTSFQVPRDLLAQHSSICGTGSESSIYLPDVKETAFEDFFIWLHVFEPRLGTKSFQAMIDLAILAETYDIYQLKNQTSDALWQKFDSEEWELSFDVFSTVYKSVPSGSILRQLCAATLAIETRRDGVSPKAQDYLELKPVFEKFPELGWDYFVQMQTFATSGGACRFHDHSDIPSWARERTEVCPYPHGAPVEVPNPEEQVINTSKPINSNGLGHYESAVESPPPEHSPAPVATSEKMEPTATLSKKQKQRNRKKSMAEPKNVALVDTSSVTSG